MLVILILACEVGFWLAVIGGLTLRYVANRPRAGLILLALAPVLDAVLLAATAADLATGGTATWAHGLAAVYIGFSLAYGHRMIAWADARFAHRRTGRPLPAPLTGTDYTRRCWADVVRTTIAVAVAGGIIGVFLVLFGMNERTAALSGWVPVLGVVLAIETLWAVSYTLWPRRAPAHAEG